MAGKKPLDLMLAIVFFAAILSLSTSSNSIPTFEWKPLTRNNFSSEIRLHRHLLLLVTVPWSGESRALMKDIVLLAAQKRDRYSELKLMFVHRNTEKTLTDVLGASKGTTLFCYHYSVAYKYQGRLRAQNILMSAYHLMLLPRNGLPIRHLNSESDLQTFLQSTDKAVLLVEFCGWTQFLLEKQHGDSSDGRKMDLHDYNMTRTATISSDDDNGAQALTDLFNVKNAQKTQESDNAPLTCGIKQVHGGHPWLDELTFRNVSSSTTGDDGRNSCALDEFEQYKSFFSMLVTISREYFLPPDRFKYGLISRKALVSKLGVTEPSTWMLLLHFMGCPNCSKILKHADDLRSTLVAPHPLVTELEDTEHNREFSLPINRPSVILFVDRASELSAVRKRSGSALKTFQKLVFDTQSTYRMVDETDGTKFAGFPGKPFPDKEGMLSNPSEVQAFGISQVPASVAHQNSMTLLFNKNEKSTRIPPSGVTHGQNAPEMLLNFLQQKYPSLQIRETEIHLLEGEDRFKIVSGNRQNPIPLQDVSPTNEVSSNAFSIFNAQMGEFSRILNGQNSADREESADLQNNANKNSDSNAEQATSVIDVVAQKLPSISDHGNGNPNLLSSILKVLEGELMVTKKLVILEADTHMKSSDHLSSYHVDSCEQICDYGHTSLQEDACHVKTIKDWICTQRAVGTLNSMAAATNSSEPEKVPKRKKQGFMSGTSFFFSDGGHRSLISLTGKSKTPSLVIVDPVRQHHYVFPEDTAFTYSALLDFLRAYLNGRLAPFQRSEAGSVIPTQVDATFGNHEAQGAAPLPHITVEEFATLMPKDVLGNNNNTEQFIGAKSGFWSSKDVIVLFRNSWCGFCLRMELVVREVYHAFTGRLPMLQKKNKLEGAHLSVVPSFFRMDCTLNDCSAILKSLGLDELYPSLVLFPADKGNAVNYDGEMSVSSIIDFILSHGSANHPLSEIEDIFWGKASMAKNSLQRSYLKPSEGHGPLGKDRQQEIFLKSNQVGEKNRPHLPDLPASATEADEREYVRLGSFLIANDKINMAPPFDKSKILIISLDPRKSFHGLIVNKRLRWDALRDLMQDIEPLEEAPLSYGGPVAVHDAPLVSLSRRFAGEGYREVLPGLFFGGHPATSKTIELIHSGIRSAADFWFFLGYSSWEWQQLYNEFAHGAWHLVNMEGQLEWPE